MLLIYLIFPFQKQKRVEGCEGLVVNLRHHVRLYHPDLVEERVKTEKKRIYEPKEC